MTVYTNVHIVLYFAIKDLNALNRMLTVYFSLRID